MVRRRGSRLAPVGSLIACTMAVALASAMPALGQQPSEAQALEDWNALEGSLERLEERIGEVIPAHRAVIIGDDHDRLLELLEQVEQDELPDIRQQLADFADTYGETPEAINAAMRERVDIDWRSGKHPRREAGDLYTALSERVQGIPEAREEKAEELLREAEGVEQRISSFSTQVTRENFAELRTALETALRYDPDNQRAQEWLDRLADEEEEAFAAIEKAIDDATWPGHDPDFAGPGDPDALARSAKEWLNADEATRDEEDPDHTIAVAVRGDWVSFKRNILGQTTQWGLPIWGAATDSAMRERGVARVFSLTILTREEAGVEKSPPWTGVAVGDSYLMRLSKIPGGGAAAGGLGGVAGFWARRELAFVTMFAGLLLLAPALRGKVRPLAFLDDHLGPLSTTLGGIVLGVSIVVILRRPLIPGSTVFSDLLPQLCGMLAGIVLVLDAGSDDPSARRGPLRLVLGASALLLGALHLVAGWLVLL